MHEVSLAGGILKLVEDTAERDGFQQVTQLHLEAGALSGVDVHALRFACAACFTDTLLAQAEVIIDEIPGSAWCMACSDTVRIDNRAQACPHCGSHQLAPNGGLELKVVDMIVKN